MSQTLNKCITALDFADKILLVLSDAGSGVSLLSFTTVSGTLVGIASASICLVFPVSNGIVRMFLKTMGKKNNNHSKIDLLVRSKLNSIEKILSKALIDHDITYDEFLPVIDEEQNYLRLIESTATKDSQLGGIERDRLIEHSKKIGTDEVLNIIRDKV